MSRQKPSSLFAARDRKQQREYDRQLDERRAEPFDQITGWIILRSVALGIALAALLNVLIGYLARF
jgi:hypothetical protein